MRIPVVSSVVLGAAITLLAPTAAACDEGAGRVAVSAAVGVGVGAGAATLTSGIIAAADDTRDYNFWFGAGIGAGVTAGLALVYALVDGSTGCTMVDGGLAWSVPITTLIVGAALPVAIWGASDEVAPTTTAASPIRFELRF